MKKLYFSFLAFMLLSFGSMAQVNHLVISQVYGAGGNSGATYNRDFVELFNPTNAPISLSGYSIQYAGATGTTWSSKALSGTVAANSYFLIQMTLTGANGSSLPVTPDYTVSSATDMAGAAGKVALVNVTTALSGGCPTGATIVDFVGYGTTANCFEGSGPTPAPSATNSVFRLSNGCTDTDDNAANFAAAAVAPRNSSSPVNICPATSSISTGSISSSVFCVNASSSAAGTVAYSSVGSFNTIFTAYLSDASGSFAAPVSIGSTSVNGTDPSGTINITIPAGTTSGNGYKIRVDATSPSTTGSVSSAFEIINGVNDVTGLSATQAQTSANISWTNPASCFDEVMVVVKQGSSISGTPSGNGAAYTADANFAGSGSAFDGGKVVYKGTGTSVNVTGLTTGNNYYIKVYSRYGNSWSNGVEINIASLGVVNHLVISQIYGGGGNANATYTNDFIEIFNPTASSVNLTGYSIQYASAAGTSWTKLDLSGSIAPYKYYLVQLASGANGTALPTPDATGSINLAAGLGKVALVNSTTILSGGCPLGAPVIDFVGYGSADCSEGGSTASGTTNNTTAFFRLNGGCTDTDNNNADFLIGAASPRNSASAPNNCSIAAGPLPVHFSNFRASQKGTGIMLYWTNETEESVISYEIERSANGRNFISIASVDPLKNDNTSVSYQQLDASPFQGDNFYRIRAVEMNGKNSYTSIIRINPSLKSAGMAIYPNPVKNGEINVQLQQLPEGQYLVRIYNLNGQLVYQKNLQHNGGAVTQNISIGKLQSGVYSLQYSGPAQLQKQFIIE